MTIKELKDWLSQWPDDLPILTDPEPFNDSESKPIQPEPAEFGVVFVDEPDPTDEFPVDGPFIVFNVFVTGEGPGQTE